MGMELLAARSFVFFLVCNVAMASTLWYTIKRGNSIKSSDLFSKYPSFDRLAC